MRIARLRFGHHNEALYICPHRRREECTTRDYRAPLDAFMWPVRFGMIWLRPMVHGHVVFGSGDDLSHRQQLLFASSAFSPAL